EEVFFLKTGIHVFSTVDRAISGDDDHRGVRALLAHAMREFYSVHPFHAKVGNENVEILLVKFLQRFLGAVGANRLVALHLKDLAAQSRQNLVVVDKQDGFHAHGTFFCYLRALIADVTMNEQQVRESGGWKTNTRPSNAISCVS